MYQAQNLWEFSRKYPNDSEGCDLVSSAMSRLLSPPAEEFTNSLFATALSRTRGQSVRVLVDNDDAMPTSGGSGVIAINVGKNAPVADADGHLSYLTLEQTIAHELVHAGQPENTRLTGYAAYCHLQAEEAARELISPEKEANRDALIQMIRETPDKANAAKLVEQLVVKYELPKAVHIGQALSADEVYQAYIRDVEEPAMVAERQIANLLGNGAIREFYSPYEMPEEMMKTYLIDLCSVELGLNAKLGTPVQNSQLGGVLAKPPIRTPGQLS